MRAYEPFEDFLPQYPRDFETIKRYLESHGKINIKDSTIEDFYYDFSEIYCAIWLTPNEESLEEFAKWLADKDI